MEDKTAYTLKDIADRQAELERQHSAIYQKLDEICDELRRVRFAAEGAESKAAEAVSLIHEMD